MKYLLQKSAISIIAFLTLGILLLLGFYFLNFTLTESKISKSQEAALKSYYLAEAGINEAIWKLKNDNTTGDGDDAWADDFVDPDKNPDLEGNYWTDEFSRSFGEGTYTVTVQNSARGRGELISVATFPTFKGRSAQRIVKTAVFKALASPIEDSAVFTGGPSENIDIMLSNLRIENGNLFSNNRINLKFNSFVEILDNPDTERLEGKALAGGNFNSQLSSIISEAICAKNTCTENCEGYPPEDSGCPPSSVDLPLVDFDSESIYSFYSRAENAQSLGQCEVLCNSIQCDNRCVYSSSDFEDLLWSVGEDGTLTLNNIITYVTGDVELRGGRRLVVNGTLVTDDNIKIGERLSWKEDSGFSQITVNQPSADKPSGLLTKRKINFGLFSSFYPVSITGVLYANDAIDITSMPSVFDIIGGIIGRKISLISLWQQLNVVLDNDIILYGLGYQIDGTPISPTYSPVIKIDHWEESY